MFLPEQRRSEFLSLEIPSSGGFHCQAELKVLVKVIFWNLN
jgi:hypothetical protein